MFKDIFVTSRNKISTRVKHSYFTTEINDILEPHSFEYQCNVSKYIMKHISLYEIFNLFSTLHQNGASSRLDIFITWLKLTDKLDRCMTIFFKHDIEMDMFLTPNTTTSTSSIEYIEQSTPQNIDDKGDNMNDATLFAFNFHVRSQHYIRCLIWVK